MSHHYLKINLFLRLLFILVGISLGYTCQAEESFPNSEPKIDIAVLLTNDPLWMKALKKPEWLVSGKQRDGKKIAFLSFADRSVSGSGSRRETDKGRLTRSVPLFMMESFFHKTNADTYMLIPTIYGEGPVLTRFEWPQEKINQMVDLEDTQKIDFVVTGAIDEPTPGIWALKIVIWDIINQTVSKTSEYEATAESFGLVVLKAKNDLIEYFASISALKIVPAPNFYKDPSPLNIDQYLLVYGQLLPLNLAANDIMSAEDIWGKEEILNAAWKLIGKAENSKVPVFLFLAELNRMSQIDSTAFQAFRYKAMTLMLEKKDSVILKLAPFIYYLYDVKDKFNSSREKLSKEADDDGLRKWLEGIDKPQNISKENKTAKS